VSVEVMEVAEKNNFPLAVRFSDGDTIRIWHFCCLAALNPRDSALASNQPLPARQKVYAKVIIILLTPNIFG